MAEMNDFKDTLDIMKKEYSNRLNKAKSEADMDETNPWVSITRKELYEKFPYLKNLSIREMIKLISLCFQMNSDGDLIYAIKCYMHSYPELCKEDNLDKVFAQEDK